MRAQCSRIYGKDTAYDAEREEEQGRARERPRRDGVVRGGNEG